MSITFKASNKQVNSLIFKNNSSLKKILHDKLTNDSESNLRYEAVADISSLIEAPNNALIHAANLAFDNHLPLTLRPDDIWLTILQSFSIHVQENSEALRSKIVDHKGKAEIIIHRNEFRKGKENNWASVFPQFSIKIKEHIGEKHNLFVAKYSTTTDLDSLVGNIVLMDIVKQYFKYTVKTMCGIPEIILEGTPDDWRKLRTKVKAFSDFDLKWWIEKLDPALKIFQESSEGNSDQKVWESFFKTSGGSGGPFITGWINSLFPYIQESNSFKKNPYFEQISKPSFLTNNTNDSYPLGYRTVPFTWDYFGDEIPMKFLGGFLGVKQNQNNYSLSPQVGWAVQEILK